MNCCVRLRVAESVSYGVSKAFSRPHNFSQEYFWHKRTVSVDSDTVLYYKLFRFFFLSFFYSSALSVFDIKMKIEWKGDQYIIL